jgi:hypothetical protein
MAEAAHRQKLRAFCKRRVLKCCWDASAVQRQVDSSCVMASQIKRRRKGLRKAGTVQRLFVLHCQDRDLSPCRQDPQRVAKLPSRKTALVPGNGDVIDDPRCGRLGNKDHGKAGTEDKRLCHVLRGNCLGRPWHQRQFEVARFGRGSRWRPTHDDRMAGDGNAKARTPSLFDKRLQTFALCSTAVFRHAGNALNVNEVPTQRRCHVRNIDCEG